MANAPLPSYRYSMRIDHDLFANADELQITELGTVSVEVPSGDLWVVDYHNNAVHPTLYSYPGTPSYSDIVLKIVKVPNAEPFYQWLSLVMNNRYSEAECEATIVQLPPNQLSAANYDGDRWHITGLWPSKWELTPMSGKNAGLVAESLTMKVSTISYDG